MRSTSESVLAPDREDLRIAWLAALAVTIHVAESALPSPLPGVKPGLANVVTIVTLCWFGWNACAWVSALRVVAAGLLTGTFLSPTFLLAAAGAASALLVLWPASRLPGRGFSPLGLSLLAAMGHMTGQFLLARWLLIPHPALLSLYPPLMTAAVIFGIVSGIIALRIVEQGPPASHP